MVKNKKEFHPGDRVFAKVRGYPPWPARVTDVIKSSSSCKYDVFFYGTYERAVVKPVDIFDYEENKVKLGAYQKRKFFQEGMQEIEDTPDIQPSFEFSPLQKTSKRSKPVPKIKEEVLASSESDGIHSKDVEQMNLSEKMAIKKSKKPSMSPKKIATDNEFIQISRSGRKIKPKKFDDDFPEPQIGKIKSELVEPSVKSEENNWPEEEIPVSRSSSYSDIYNSISYHSSSGDSDVEPNRKKIGESSKSYSDQNLSSQNKKKLQNEPPKKKTSKSSKGKLIIKGFDLPKKHRTVEPLLKNDKENVPQKVTKAPSNLQNINTSKFSDLFNPKDKSKWITIKPQPKSLTVVTKAGVTVDIIYDADRPEHYSSLAKKLAWDLDIAKKLCECKAALESGKYVPPEIQNKLSGSLTSEEEESKIKEAQDIMSWLRKEISLVGLDSRIVQSMQIGKEIDEEYCVSLLDEMLDIPIEPFMLIKNSVIVGNIRKCMCFRGSTAIREKAGRVYARFKSLFDVDEDEDFRELFMGKLREYFFLTKDMSVKERTRLLEFPSSDSLRRRRSSNLSSSSEDRSITEKSTDMKDDTAEQEETIYKAADITNEESQSMSENNPDNLAGDQDRADTLQDRSTDKLDTEENQAATEDSEGLPLETDNTEDIQTNSSNPEGSKIQSDDIDSESQEDESGVSIS